MKRSTYNKIVSVIESQPWDFDSCLIVLKNRFPEECVETLRSILAQEHKKKVKHTHSYQVIMTKVVTFVEQFFIILDRLKHQWILIIRTPKYLKDVYRSTIS